MPTPRPTAAPTRPAPAAAPASDGLAILEQGKKSNNARTRNLAAKIGQLLEQLDGALRDETAARKAAAAKAREDAEKKARIAQLEAELAALKGKPATKKAAAPTSGPLAADVRAWARGAGVDCPANGRIPRTVREAYDAAHQDDAA